VILEAEGEVFMAKTKLVEAISQGGAVLRQNHVQSSEVHFRGVAEFYDYLLQESTGSPIKGRDPEQEI
jgi:hypothetical protein